MRGVLHHFQATEHIAFGIGQGLALLGAEQRSQFGHVFPDQLLVFEKTGLIEDKQAIFDESTDSISLLNGLPEKE